MNESSLFNLQPSCRSLFSSSSASEAEIWLSWACTPRLLDDLTCSVSTRFVAIRNILAFSQTSQKPTNVSITRSICIHDFLLRQLDDGVGGDMAPFRNERCIRALCNHN